MIPIAGSPKYYPTAMPLVGETKANIFEDIGGAITGAFQGVNNAIQGGVNVVKNTWDKVSPYIMNQFTGNLDYQRQLDLMERQQSANMAAAERDRQFNADQAALARAFSERMSSTAYQRAANDLRAAGFNPAYVLSAGAASAPAGSAASAHEQGVSASYNAPSYGGYRLLKDVVDSVNNAQNKNAAVLMTILKLFI